LAGADGHQQAGASEVRGGHAYRVTFADITFVRNPPIAGPLTLNKVEPIPTRADRLRRDHERDSRAAVPVFLALRGTRRPAGPGLPLPRRPPLGRGAREARRGPRCLPRTPGRRTPAPPGRDLGACPPAVGQRPSAPRPLGTPDADPPASPPGRPG